MERSSRSGWAACEPKPSARLLCPAGAEERKAPKSTVAYDSSGTALVFNCISLEIGYTDRAGDTSKLSGGVQQPRIDFVGRYIAMQAVH